MKTKYCYLILVFLFTSPMIFVGQGFMKIATHPQDSTIEFNPFVDDITLRIPQLEDLIDSAIVHSPLLWSQDADIAIWKYKVKTAKREWMQNLYIDGQLQNDIWDALTNNRPTYGDNNSIVSYQNNYRYLASISLRLPMDDFWDRKNRIKTANKEVEKAIAIKSSEIIELRKIIIVQYNQLIVNQRILKIANDNVIANALQKEMGDKEFLNGQTTLYELAYINEMYRKAVTDFEQSRNEFYNAYMILQEIAGIKFNVINKIDF
ncbi:MAG: TolC family protein [Bacteroidales bacterium]|nr:TolC family protein [Bacteroidales bacterium]MDD4604346.1 TolC family protein [Bacteroidales bacterium]